MFNRYLLIIFFAIFLGSCSSKPGQDHQKKLAELDKVYGPCNNPHRQYTPTQKKVCEDKARAAGPDGVVGDPINLTGLLDGIRGGGKVVAAVSDTNNYLWDSSLQILDNYSLKITDFEGGYIETNWIQESDKPNQRCLIKSHITSQELVSNGVKVKIICENKIDGDWYISSENFVDEEKQITLKILQEAQTLAKLAIVS